jgi:hypothetical protein
MALRSVIEAFRAILPETRFLQPDPVIHVFPSPEQPKTDPKKSPPAEVVSSTLRVRIESATAYPRTFRVESADEPLDLAAAKKALEAFQSRVKGEPRLEVKVYQNSTAVDHPDVREFIEHAHRLSYATRVDKVGERLP